MLRTYGRYRVLIDSLITVALMALIRMAVLGGRSNENSTAKSAGRNRRPRPELIDSLNKCLRCQFRFPDRRTRFILEKFAHRISRSARAVPQRALNLSFPKKVKPWRFECLLIGMPSGDSCFPEETNFLSDPPTSPAAVVRVSISFCVLERKKRAPKWIA